MKRNTSFAIGFSLYCALTVLFSSPARQVLYHFGFLWAIAVVIGAAAFLLTANSFRLNFLTRYRAIPGVIGGLLAVVFNPGWFAPSVMTYALTALGGGLMLLAILGNRPTTDDETEGKPEAIETLLCILSVTGMVLLFGHGLARAAGNNHIEHLVWMVAGGLVTVLAGIPECLSMLRDCSTLTCSFYELDSRYGPRLADIFK